MGFNFAAASYIVALICDAFLIFFAIFHTIAFDELKTDYKWVEDLCNSLDFDLLFTNLALPIFRNPIDSCNSLNPLVLPEYAVHILINIFFLIAGEWVSLIMNAPLIAYHIWRYKNRPQGMTGPGLYDPTNIMNSDTLSKAMKEGALHSPSACTWANNLITKSTCRLDQVGSLFIVVLLLSLWVSIIRSCLVDAAITWLISAWSHHLSQHKFAGVVSTRTFMIPKIIRLNILFSFLSLKHLQYYAVVSRIIKNLPGSLVSRLDWTTFHAFVCEFRFLVEMYFVSPIEWVRSS